MKRQICVLFTLVVFGVTTWAGPWERVKAGATSAARPLRAARAKASACAKYLSGKGSEVASGTAARARYVRGVGERVRRQLRELLEGMTTLYAQLREIGAVGKNCGRASVKTIGTEAGPMVARIIGFEGRLVDLKDGIILPLMSRVRAVREAREQKLSADVLAARLTSLAIFLIETKFKVPRCAIMAAQATLAGAVGGVTVGVTNDIPGWNETIAAQFAPEVGAAVTGTDLTRLLIGNVVANIKRALTQPDLKLSERLGEIFSVEVILIDWFRKVGPAVGWDDVETELRSWRRTHAPLLLTDQNSI